MLIGFFFSFYALFLLRQPILLLSLYGERKLKNLFLWVYAVKDNQPTSQTTNNQQTIGINNTVFVRFFTWEKKSIVLIFKFNKIMITQNDNTVFNFICATGIPFRICFSSYIYAYIYVSPIRKTCIYCSIP